jgi:hypothetical protein
MMVLRLVVRGLEVRLEVRIGWIGCEWNFLRPSRYIEQNMAFDRPSNHALYALFPLISTDVLTPFIDLMEDALAQQVPPVVVS